MTHNYTGRRKFGSHKKSVKPKHTGRHFSKNRTISEGHYHSMEVEDGEYKFSCGNLTDAGWFWDGGTEDAWLFLNRMRKSKVRDALVQDVNKQEFEEFKKVLEEQLAKDNYGLYGLSGDNVEWHFGQEWVDYEYEFGELQGEYNLTDAEREKLAEKTYDLEEGGSFEEFAKEHDYKDEVRDILTTSDSMAELMDEGKWEDLQQGIVEDVVGYRNDKFYTAVNKALDELGYRAKKMPEDQKTVGEAM